MRTTDKLTLEGTFPAFGGMKLGVGATECTVSSQTASTLEATCAGAVAGHHTVWAELADGRRAHVPTAQGFVRVVADFTSLSPCDREAWYFQNV